MRRLVHAILLIISIFAVNPASALPSRPEPPRLVNDFAGIFTSAQTEMLERTLVAFDDSTSNQIAVVTVLDLEGYEPSEFATRIGIDWQVGSEEFDNGVVVLVKPKTGRSAGQVFIAVGYGLEGAVPDVYAKRIIENVMIPHFRNGDYFSGVEDACDVLMGLASGEFSTPRERNDEDPIWMVFGIFFIIFLSIFILALLFGDDNHRGNRGRRTIYVGPIITNGRSYGGSSFGSGFGGFGGGSFGGGGAGGSW